MKIAVDLTYIREEYTTGLATFSFSLLRGFKENGQADEILLLVEAGYEAGFAHRIAGFKTLPVKTSYLPKLPFTRGPLFRKRLDKILENEEIDILLSPYLYDRTLYNGKVPGIAVIHDTKLFDQKNPLLRWRFRFGAFRVANRMSRIVTISQNAAAAIKELRKIKTPVEVIYVSVVSHANPAAREAVNPPYILDVNTLVDHKNPLTLIKAFELLKDRIPHRLVFKGRRTPYWDNVLAPYIAAHGLTERVELNDALLSQEEMDRLYLNADLFVTPSEMEGFGATPIEASLAGVPVICNALPTLLESTRGLVNYYAPAQDASALADKIVEVLDNKDATQLEVIRRAYQEAYSPSHQAACFYHLAEAICGGRS